MHTSQIDLRRRNLLLLPEADGYSRGGKFPTLGQAGLFVVACTGLLFWIAASAPPFPIVSRHNVKVLQKVAENKWWMTDDEDRQGFLFTACPDFPNGTVIWAGYIAREARWQEQGACKSIRRSDLGFWWSRDEQFNARRIDQ